METIQMFVCLVSLNFPLFPEVCALQIVESHGPDSDVEYCLAVHTALATHPDQDEWDGAVAFCALFDAERDTDRLNESDERMHGNVTAEEFTCMTDSTVRC